MFNVALDSISPGFVNDCVRSAVIGDLGHATEGNWPHKSNGAIHGAEQQQPACPLHCMFTAVLCRTHCNNS